MIVKMSKYAFMVFHKEYDCLLYTSDAADD